MIYDVVVGHTGASASQQTREALRGYPAVYCKLLTDTDYVDLIERRWGGGRAFILVEHDIIPWRGALEELTECDSPWCAFQYPYLGRLHAGLGCCRFSKELLQAAPQAARRAAEYEDELHPSRHWCSFDTRLGSQLMQAGYRVHVHSPPVGHLNPRNTAHGCLERQGLVPPPIGEPS